MATNENLLASSPSPAAGSQRPQPVGLDSADLLGRRRNTPADVDILRIAQDEGAEDLAPVISAIYGQESGSGASQATSVNGARGGMQIIPDTFRRYAIANENIDDPVDNARVAVRYIKDLASKFGNDPAKIAAGYFSGEGNVNRGEGQAWKQDNADGNGKRTSGYVNDVLKRLGVTPGKPAAAAPDDLSDIPAWPTIVANPEYAKLSSEDRRAAKERYFDYYIAPRAGADSAGLRQRFLANDDGVPEAPGMWDKIKSGVSDAASRAGEMVASAYRAPGLAYTKPETAAELTPAEKAVYQAQYNAATPEQRLEMEAQGGKLGRFVNEKNVEAGVSRPWWQVGLQGATSGMGTTILEGFKKQGAGLSIFAVDQFPDSIDTSPPGVDEREIDLLGGPRGWYEKMLGVRSNEELRAYKQRAVQGSKDDISRSEEAIKAATPKNLTLMERGIRGAAESIVQNAPGMALGIATGNPIPALATMGVQTSAGSYAEARAKGLEPGAAARYAAIDGVIEVATEAIPAGKLLSIFGAKDLAGIKKQLGHFIAGEMVGEQVATLGQSLNAYAHDLDEELANAKTLEEKARIQGERQALTAISTILQSGVQGGGMAAARHGYNTYTTAQANNAANAAQNAAMNRWQTNGLTAGLNSGAQAPGASATPPPAGGPPPPAGPASGPTPSSPPPAQPSAPTGSSVAPAAGINDQDLVDQAELRMSELQQRAADEEITPDERRELGALSDADGNPAALRQFYGLTQAQTQETSDEGQSQAQAQQGGPAQREQSGQGDSAGEADGNGQGPAGEARNAGGNAADGDRSGGAGYGGIPAEGSVNGPQAPEAKQAEAQGQEPGATPEQVAPPRTEREARLARSNTAGAKTYSVDTEDNGTFEAKVLRSKDGGVTIFIDGHTIEHNAAFSQGKTDGELLRYSFEPLGFRSATEAASVAPKTEREAIDQRTAQHDQHELEGLGTVHLPVDQLTLSAEVPQFKDGANAQGVVEPLGGKFDRTGLSPIQVWRRNDGRLEVISGRHRLDLARRSGEKTIPAQIHNEADGFDASRAAILDAELNIRDEKGKVKDYVSYFQGSKITRQEAVDRGLLARAIGKRAYTIASGGSEALIAAHRADAISDEGAYQVATFAPNDERLQAVGIRALQEGKSAENAVNLMQAVKAMAGERGETTGDMFGFDDSAMREAEEMAKIAGRKQRELSTRLSAISGAARNPALAKKEGVDVNNPDALKKRIEQLKKERTAWDSWSTNPDLISQIRADMGGQLTLTTQTQEELKKKAADEDRAAAEQAAADKAAEDKAKADKQVGQFELEGEGITNGQDDMFGNTSAAPKTEPQSAGDPYIDKRIEIFSRLKEIDSEAIEAVKAANPQPKRGNGVSYDSWWLGVLRKAKTEILKPKYADRIHRLNDEYKAAIPGESFETEGDYLPDDFFEKTTHPDLKPKTEKEAKARKEADKAELEGADAAETNEIGQEFKNAAESASEDDFQMHHLFDAPEKGDVVRLEDKVKVHVAGQGWMTPAEAKKKIAEWKAHAAAQGKTRKNSDKIVLSLFDLTGEWSKPWEEAGYQVYRFDIQNNNQVEHNGELINADDINNFSTDFFDDIFASFDGQDIHAVLAACPCTDFASSGARHFAAKDADGRTIDSVNLVHMTLATIEYFKPATWAIENPVGRIEKLAGLPPWRLSFNPNHLGDPYTKKTLLWGRFNADLPIAPVEPTEGSKMHSQYGGKSQATKNARSVTPEGFAYAFFMANNAIDHPAMALANKYDRMNPEVFQEALDAGLTEREISSAIDDQYYMDLDDSSAEQALRSMIDERGASEPDFDAMFDNLMNEGSTPAAPPKTEREAKERKAQQPNPKPKTERAASEAAVSAAKNSAAAADAALRALGELFGGKGKMSSGLTFDEESYAKAKPLFLEAVKHMKQAGQDIEAVMRAIINRLKELFNDVVARNMQPYVVRFTKDVYQRKIRLEENDAAPPSENSEQSGEGSEAAPQGNADSVPNESEGTGEVRRGANQGAGGGRSRSPRGERVPGSGTSSSGESSDQRVRDEDGRFKTEDDAAGSADETGSTGDSGQGSDAGRQAETSPVVVAPLEERLRQQKAAESIEVKLGNAENIRETLPLLMPSQHEDVHFAEKRLTKANGYGVLFTNGTGTGKTFLGLGIVKRMVRSGKTNGLIVVPNDAVMTEWTRSAERIGLTITALNGLNDSGKGVSITTYANLANNLTLADRAHDFVVADEAHNLMANQAAETTGGLKTLRAITLHPDSAYQRLQMVERDLLARISSVSKSITALEKSLGSDDMMIEMRIANEARSQELQAELKELMKKRDAAAEREREKVSSSQGAARPRAVFLSASPFAYEKNTEWAQGYLFDYNRMPEGQTLKYNEPDGREQFLIQHFGYRMRHNKITEPDAKVDRGLMQRQFNTWLRQQGSLSARMLDVDKDYDRKFVLVEAGIGIEIDRALKWLRESNGGLYSQFFHAAMDKFDYLSRSRLLEAIKADAAIPYIRAHHELGRKVIVFYDFNEGGGFNPFSFHGDRNTEIEGSTYDKDTGKTKQVKFKMGQFLDDFAHEFPSLSKNEFGQRMSPLDTLTRAFPNAAVYNGVVKKSGRQQGIDDFNNDDKPEANLLIVQSAANAGWSGHDTSGKFQRVIVNLGLPVAPVKAIQQEGRAYRVGQASDAIFRYFNTGTLWERAAFADKVARRASTAENLAMGEQARGLLQSFLDAFEETSSNPPERGEGKGGKKKDRDLATTMSDFDRAISYYFGQQKKNSRTKAAEGEDYYATPEPIGLKMVEWLHSEPGDKVLEPSAGHGAIARWLPDYTDRTVVEPSLELASRLGLITDARQINDRFENLHITNKYNGIVMNPPFGVGGKVAIDHLAKAFTHLSEGGRLVALIPEGPAANKRFEEWLYAKDERGRSKLDNAHLIRSLTLPAFAFERAGTNVKTRIVVIDKHSDPRIKSTQANFDMSEAADNINELFDLLRNVDVPRARGVSDMVQPNRSKSDTPAAPGRVVDDLTDATFRVEGKKLITDAPVAQYTTKAGKLLEGVYVPDRNTAASVDAYTFKTKEMPGYFVRLAHVVRPAQSVDSGATGPTVIKQWSTGSFPVSEADKASGLRDLGTLIRKRDKGKFTSDEFELAVRQLHVNLREKRENKQIKEALTDRRRGGDWISAQVRRYVADGTLSRREADFMDWLLRQNPNLANGLGISHPTAPENSNDSGQYEIADRVIVLFKNRSNNGRTGVHEILHHFERMMPSEVQKGVYDAWSKAWVRAHKKASPQRQQALEDMLAASLGNEDAETRVMQAARDGHINIAEDYQLLSPSEFWAENGSRILSNRFDAQGSWIQRAIQFFKELYERAKGAFGLPSDAPVLRALREAMQSEGKFIPRQKMIIDQKRYAAPAQGNLPGMPPQAPQPQMVVQRQAPLTGGQVVAPWQMSDMTRKDNFIYTVQDRHIDLKRVQQAIAGVRRIGDQFNAYMREELFHGRVADRSHQFLDRELRPLLQDMEFKGIEMEELEAYLWARHAVERNAQNAKINPMMPDGGSGLTNAEVAAYMQGIDVLDAQGNVVIKGLNQANRNRLDQLAARVDAINAGTKQVLIQYGLESSSTIANWDATYQHYVPLHREDLADVTPIGQGYSVKGSSSKRAIGSSRKVVNIIANLAMQREAAITRGEKNRVALSLYGLARQNPNADFWETDTVPMVAKIDKTTGLATWIPDPQYKNRDNVLVLRIGGKDRSISFNVKNPRAARMAEVMRNLDVERLEAPISWFGTATRYFASINTQYNPVFGFVNGMRDVQAALVNLTSTEAAGLQAQVLNNVRSTMFAIWDIERGGTGGSWGPVYRDLLSRGGTTGYREIFRTAPDRAKDLVKEIEDLRAGRTKKLGKATLKVLDDFNTAIENGTRLAVYKAAIDAGIPPDRAASIAKNITVNFNRKGKIGSTANTFYAFFNAGVQATARNLETLNSPTGRKIMAAGVLLGMAQTMIGIAAFGDDDWENIPEFIKARNLIVPVGGKQYIQIPMSLGLNVFPTIGRIATDMAIHPGRKVFEKSMNMLTSFTDTMIPVDSLYPTPTAIITDIQTNKDFTGRDIAKQNVNPLAPTPGFTRAKDSSSGVSRWLAEKANSLSGGTDYTPGHLSPTPDHIDYVFGVMTGGIGRELNKAYQSIDMMRKGQDVPEYKKPFISRFYGRTDEDVATTTRFWNSIKDINILENEMKGRNKDNKPTDDLEKAFPETELIQQANSVERQISKMRAERHKFEFDKSLTEKERTEQLKEADDSILQMMKDFNEDVSATRKAARQKKNAK